MAEEAKATEAQPAKTEVIPRSPTELDIDMIADEHAKQAIEDFGGLFSDEARASDEQLKEEAKPEDKKPSEVKEEVKPDSKAAPPKPEGDLKKEPEKKEEPKKEAKEEKKKEEKPPEGFVRKEALAESRAKLRAVSDENARLKAQLAAKPPVQEAPADESKWKNFKVKTDEELEQLIEDDPIEAQKYQAKLHKFERYQDGKREAQKEAEQSKVRFQSLVDQTVTRIKEAVPGIYDEDSEVSSQLAEFAVQHGFEDDNYLDAMTNPATLIVPPGQDKSYLLGPGAAAFIKLLHTLRAKLSTASDPAKLKEEITKELEPKLREAITTELVSKFKDAGTGKFKSLTDVPGSGDKPEKVGPLTEEAWARLTPDEREKYLQAT